MSTKPPVGVRALDTMFKANPSISIARMSAEQLEKAQTTVIPDSGPAALVLGRLQKGVGVRTTSYAAPHGEVPLRIYTPESWSRTTRPVVVNFHGGGFALGSSRQCDWSCSVVAKNLDAIVVSVDYRLAPTHRFPAAVDDCYGGLVWAAEHAAELGGDPGRIGVMGDSAGGNLAAVVSIMAREQDGPAIGHQALIYPAVDFTDGIRETASYQADTRIVLTNADMEVFHGHYLPEDADPFDWRLSPLHAPDLSGLPPAVVVVAGLDPLHDSGVQYAQALADAGNDVTVEDFHLMPHGFVAFPYFSKSARPAMDAIVASQRVALF